MSDGDLYVRTEGGYIPLRFKLSIGRENERGDVVPLVSMRVSEAVEILLRPAPQVEDLVKALEPLAALAEVFDQPGGTQPTFGPIHEWSRMVDGAPKDYSLTVEMLREARAALAAYRKD